MATYYVDWVNGDDANAGTSEGSGNAWKTIQKAANTVTNNDIVNVKATASYLETITLAFSAASNTPVLMRGYTSTPGDGGMVTIDGESTRANGWTSSAATRCTVFENFTVTNCTGSGWNFSTVEGCSFRNCHASSCGVHGFFLDRGNCVYNCTSNNHTGAGFNQVSGASTFVRCGASGNTSSGFNLNNSTIFGCVSHSNAAVGIQVSQASTLSTGLVAYNTVDGDSKDTNQALYFSGGTNLSPIIGNICYDCDVGILGVTNGNTVLTLSINNCVNNNTTQYSTWSQNADDVTGAPLFVDETTQDFRLQSGSSCRGTGVGYGTWNIGAYQEPAGAGGGGGLKLHPGMTGHCNA